MSKQNEIICIGEILWDALPSGLYLGGAPLNVCYHLNRFGVTAAIASRVGNDRLGREASARIRRKGIPDDYIQVDEQAETGFVRIELNEKGDPDYDIVQPVAWDFVEFVPALGRAVRDTRGVVFGSLAQRNERTRTTIQQLWDTEAKKIFDMNLRPPFVDRDIVTASLEVADIVKVNDHEMDRLQKWYGLPAAVQKAADALADRFACSLICITRGKEGAQLYRDGRWYEHAGFPVTTRDAVGAGDAFLAAMLFGFLRGKEGEDLLAYANAAGALVAGMDGATPAYTMQDVLEVMHSR